MAFILPPGLKAADGVVVETDADVAAIETAQPSGTRMLVHTRFAFKWPGFGVSADIADAAVRALSGLRTWPELGRVVYSDPDGEPVWYFAYLSSPAWWMLVLAACAVAIAAAITLRIVWTVVPEPFRAPIEMIGQVMPIVVLALLAGMVIPMLTEGMRAPRPP